MCGAPLRVHSGGSPLASGFYVARPFQVASFSSHIAPAACKLRTAQSGLSTNAANPAFLWLRVDLDVDVASVG
jgi:hypothetical protein